jgi:hypothetical protein
MGILRHVADLGAHGVGEACRVFAQNVDRPGLGRKKAERALEKRGFACAVASYETHYVTNRHRPIETGENGLIVESLGNASHLDCG